MVLWLGGAGSRLVWFSEMALLIRAYPALVLPDHDLSHVVTAPAPTQIDHQ